MGSVFVLCVCEKEKEDAHQPHNRSMQRRRAIPLLLVAWLGVGRSAPARLLLELTPIPAGTDASEGSFIDWNGHRYMARPLDRIANAAAAFPPPAPPPAEHCEEEHVRPPDPHFYYCLAIVVGLVTLAGMMAGCTMGVLSLDPLLLKLKQLEGTPEEQRWANKVLPLLRSHHWLLVALLLCNAAANEALPIFLDKLVDETTAILISVSCVLIFGEILPSAIMTGPRQLQIAAALAPAIRCLLILTAPIAWPMAKLLDRCLGHQDGLTRFKRNEFKALIKLQHKAKGWGARTRGTVSADARAVAVPPVPSLTDPVVPSASSAVAADHAAPTAFPAPPPVTLARERTPAVLRKQLSNLVVQQRRGGANGTPTPSVDAETDFSDDEVTILHSVFNLQSKRVVDLLEAGRNTWADVRMLSDKQRMDFGVMSTITRWGVSRVPIYRGESRSNVMGLLLVKEHLALDPDDAVPITSLQLRRPLLIHPSVSIFDALNVFQTGRSHLALVTESAELVARCWAEGRDVPPDTVILGVATIEDVIEEMIGEEVLDETDVAVTPGERAISPDRWGGSAKWTPPSAESSVAITEAQRAEGFTPRDSLLGSVNRS